jgi:hypothetical protein
MNTVAVMSGFCRYLTLWCLWQLFAVCVFVGPGRYAVDHMRVITASFPILFVSIAYGALLLERRAGTKLVLSHAVIHWGAAIIGSYLLYVFL